MVFLSVIIPRHISFLLALLLATLTAGAQTSAQTEQSETVKALLTRIDKLEQRVAELEAGKNTSSTLPQTQDSQTPRAAVVEESLSSHMHEEHQQNGRGVEPHFPSMQLHGFADVDFSATDEPGTFSGFNLGQFVLHVASPLSK